MLRTITAFEQDGFNRRILVLVFDVPNEAFDLEAAVRAASVEYCRTEEGKDTYEGNCHCFNWADFDMYVPDEICEKHGFKKVRTESAEEFVNWDEQLVQDEDVYPDENE